MRLISIFGLLVFLFSCKDESQNKSSSQNIEARDTDIISGPRIVTYENIGLNYGEKAVGYSLVHGKDTSCFRFIFVGLKDSGKVWIDINTPLWKIPKTYKERLNELSIVLSEAHKTYNFDSIVSVDVGRFILTGDLAIDVTKQYLKKFGPNYRIDKNFYAFDQFLKKSKLVTDMNRIFKPYSISVSDISTEKAFFLPKKHVILASKIETDTVDIPDKVLDILFCNVGLKHTKN